MKKIRRFRTRKMKNKSFYGRIRAAVSAAALALCIAAGGSPVIAGELTENAQTVKVANVVTNREVVNAAEKWIGKIHYADDSKGESHAMALQDGGSSDCSWFIYHVLHSLGLMKNYARSVAWGQGAVPDTKKVEGGISHAVPGDIEFWDEGNDAGHVAIYVGDGKAVACNGYFTEAYRQAHQGYVGMVELCSDQTTIGRNPDSVWRLSSNDQVTYKLEGETVDMYRMYNKKSGEHLYTADEAEKNHLMTVGWRYEGIGWQAPAKSERPVYRLYNPNTEDHHYTLVRAERDMLIKAGWRYEGVGWYSASPSEGTPLYRQYNPNAKTGQHNYTLSKGEAKHLIGLGWRDEGISWYAAKTDNTVSHNDNQKNQQNNEKEALSDDSAPLE